MIQRFFTMNAANNTGNARGEMYKRIEHKLLEEYKPVHLLIHDDSHKHAGHVAMKGFKPVETHFRIELKSDKFKGKTLLQRHRMVHDTLKDELQSIHALQLKLEPI